MTERWAQSLGQLAERFIVVTNDAALGFFECCLACARCAQRRNDQALAIGRQLELCLGGDLQQLENWLVDDDARTVSDSPDALSHSRMITLL